MTGEHQSAGPGAPAPSDKPGMKLSRGMKIGLTGLLLVAAVGGWALWNSSRSAEPSLGDTPAPAVSGTESAATSSAASSAAGVSTQASSTPAATGGVNVTRPQNPVKVQQVPFLTPAQAAAGTSTGGSSTSASSVASAAPAAEMPSVNPFRPFRVAPTQAAAPSAPAGQGALPAPSLPVPTVRAPSVSSAQALPTPSGPSAAPPVVVRPGGNAGALPLPVLPGTSPSAASPGVSPPVALPGASAVTVRPGQPAAGQSPVAQVPPRPAIKTPTPKVIAPSVSSAASAAAPQTPGAAVALPTLPTPQASAPHVLTQLDVAAATPATSTGPAAVDTGAPATSTAATAPSLTALDQFVSNQALSYTAVVLGPINTGVFSSKDGYVVVAVGQKLPGSDVTVKDITADSATLALGNDVKKLDISTK